MLSRNLCVPSPCRWWFYPLWCHGGNTGKERNSREDGKLIIGHSESRRQCSLPYVTLGKKTGDSDA